MAVLGLTPDEERKISLFVWKRLREGKSEEEISEELGLNWDQYETVKTRVFDEAGEEIRGRPVEHVYVQYLIDQLRCVAELITAMDSFKTSKQFSAFVGAIRAKSEIYDKLLKQGQELGLIARTASGALMPGVNVGDLSNHELRGAITRELSNLNSLVERYGKQRGLMDIDPGPLHRDSDPVKMQKTKPHARNKVNRGRRVVKRK